MKTLASLRVLAAAAAFAAQAPAQQTAPPLPESARSSTAALAVSPNYVLGREDQITIQGLDADELTNRPYRIDSNGNVVLPMLGSMHAAGMTLLDFSKQLNQELAKYVQNPQLTVGVTELRSQPVSIVGAVNQPGVQQIQGQKSLVEMISMAGGVRQDAGYSLNITRRMENGVLPLPNAKTDPSGQFSIAEVGLKDLLDAKTPESNIKVMPHDVISVPKAELVYVIGEVKKSGGFVLGDKQNVSVLQALSLAEGLDRTAVARNAKILRDSGTKQRTEIPVNVDQILKGRSSDVPLQADDILFIPGSKSRRAALRALETIVQTGSGVVIWRGGRY